MKDFVNAVLAELFTALEQRFAARPLVQMMLHTLEPAAASLVDAILAGLAAKGITPPKSA